MPEHSMVVYGALCAWCKSCQSKTHNWPPKISWGVHLKLSVGLMSLLVAAAAAAAPVAPEAMLPVVGNWSIQETEGGNGIRVDGSRWRAGSPSERLDEAATKVFTGEKERFVGAVKRQASFPLALADVPSLSAGTVQVRFKPLAGKEDQAAGIAFAIQSSGDYLILRANALEDNLILFRFKDGRRSVLKEVSHVPAKTDEWHTLRRVPAAPGPALPAS